MHRDEEPVRRKEALLKPLQGKNTSLKIQKDTQQRVRTFAWGGNALAQAGTEGSSGAITTGLKQLCVLGSLVLTHSESTQETGTFLLLNLIALWTVSSGSSSWILTTPCFKSVSVSLSQFLVLGCLSVSSSLKRLSEYTHSTLSSPIWWIRSYPQGRSSDILCDDAPWCPVHRIPQPLPPLPAHSSQSIPLSRLQLFAHICSQQPFSPPAHPALNSLFS